MNKPRNRLEYLRKILDTVDKASKINSILLSRATIAVVLSCIAMAISIVAIIIACHS